MKFIEDILDYILSLDRETFKRYTFIFMGSAILLIGAATYFIHNKTQDLVSQIQTMQKLAKKSARTASDYKRIQAKKQQVISLLDREKSFEIKSFFEKFSKENVLNPEPNWTALSSSIEGNIQLEETILPVTFKKLTMQKLVSIIEALNKNEMIYIKTLSLNKNKDKTISVDLTLATFNYKKP